MASVNAIIRADIKVEAGKLTEATMQHRAAQINFKLVSEAGGEAIADTAWSVLTSSGDIVSESVSAFPTMVLAEGEYTAIARNKDKIYQREFSRRCRAKHGCRTAFVARWQQHQAARTGWRRYRLTSRSQNGSETTAARYRGSFVRRWPCG